MAVYIVVFSVTPNVEWLYKRGQNGLNFSLSDKQAHKGALKIPSVLTLILLTWRIWWAPNNVSRWEMGFNLAFKELKENVK